MLRFQAGDTPETRLEKLEQNLSQYRLSLEESVSLFAALLSLPVPKDRYPPLNLTPQRQRQKTLGAIVAIMLELAERQPVLFILEDLHWTDPTTLELLNLLIDQTPTASMCALLTCRPEFQPSWSHRSYLTEVTVNRLSRSQIERMAHQVADGKRLPTEVIQQLVDKTDGVPLYVEEMTKAVLESGALKEVDGHYELAGSIASLSIPATLQDSLMARLDRLVTAKGVAQYASVIGRQFSYEMLQAVSGLEEATLQRELGRLVEAELIYQRGVLPDTTYLFKHALIQDIAYESLLRSTRQGYHRCIAEVLEEQFPETAERQPELLARHYTEAGFSELAIGYWQEAGEKAMQRSAHVEAITHLNKGLEVLKTLPESAELVQKELMIQVALGTPLIATKGNAAPDVERVYARARELCQQVGNTPQFFLVLRGLIVYYMTRGQLQTATQLGEQLLRLAHAQHDPALLLLAHYQLGMVLFWRGKPASAHTHHTQALAIYTPQAHRALAWRYGTDLGVGSGGHVALELWYLGYPDQALQHSQSARTLAQDMSHPFSLAFALTVTAMLHQIRREVPAAHEQSVAGLHLATEQEFAQWWAWGTVLRGWTQAMQGQEEVGIAGIRQGLTASVDTGSQQFQPYFLGLLAEAYGKNGHPEEGLPPLAEALAVIDTTEARYYEAELHRLNGELLLQQSADNATEAESCFQQAISIAQNQSAKSWELRAATSLARFWQSQGKRDEARELLAPVYEWFTEGFDTADLIDAKSLLDELA
jgi:predicted ATPase